MCTSFVIVDAVARGTVVILTTATPGKTPRKNGFNFHSQISLVTKLVLSKNLLKINIAKYVIPVSDKFHEEIQNICRRVPGSPKYAKRGNFTLFFGRERQRNVQRVITQVHGHRSAQ